MDISDASTIPCKNCFLQYLPKLFSYTCSQDKTIYQFIKDKYILLSHEPEVGAYPQSRHLPLVVPFEEPQVAHFDVIPNTSCTSVISQITELARVGPRVLDSVTDTIVWMAVVYSS